MTILPKTAKDSGSTVVDLVKWIVSGKPHDTSTYFYGDTGHIYKRTSGGTWSDERTVANSGGQGLEVLNDYLYYTQDTQLGRYGPLSGGAAFNDDFQITLEDTSTTNFAPMKQFLDFVAVAHGNKVNKIYGTESDGGAMGTTAATGLALTLPEGFQIRTVDIVDEFLVFGAWRGTAVTDVEQGFLFFWDGTAATFNFHMEIPEGAANAVVNSRNRLLSIVGSSGLIYLNYAPFNKRDQLVGLLPSQSCDEVLQQSAESLSEKVV